MPLGLLWCILALRELWVKCPSSVCWRCQGSRTVVFTFALCVVVHGIRVGIALICKKGVLFLLLLVTLRILPSGASYFCDHGTGGHPLSVHFLEVPSSGVRVGGGVFFPTSICALLLSLVHAQ